MYRVRQFEEQDIPKAGVIESVCFSEPWSEEALCSFSERTDARLFCAEDDGEFCGYIGFCFVGDEGELANLAVEPTARRRGIGRALLAAVFAECEALKIARLFLEVREANTAARALYEAEGFVECGRRKGFYVRPKEDAILYAKRFGEETL